MKKKSIFLALENRNVDVEIKVTKNKKNEKKNMICLAFEKFRENKFLKRTEIVSDD